MEEWDVRGEKTMLREGENGHTHLIIVSTLQLSLAVDRQAATVVLVVVVLPAGMVLAVLLRTDPEEVHVGHTPAWSMWFGMALVALLNPVPKLDLGEVVERHILPLASAVVEYIESSAPYSRTKIAQGEGMGEVVDCPIPALAMAMALGLVAVVLSEKPGTR